VKVCGISDIKCYQKVVQQSIEQNVHGSQTSDCDCLPSCTSITYDTEVNQVEVSDDAKKFEAIDDSYLHFFGCDTTSPDEELDYYDHLEMNYYVVDDEEYLRTMR
jgi:hypothetical protein